MLSCGLCVARAKQVLPCAPSVVQHFGEHLHCIFRDPPARRGIIFVRHLLAHLSEGRVSWGWGASRRDKHWIGAAPTSQLSHVPPLHATPPSAGDINIEPLARPRASHIFGGIPRTPLGTPAAATSIQLHCVQVWVFRAGRLAKSGRPQVRNGGLDLRPKFGARGTIVRCSGFDAELIAKTTNRSGRTRSDRLLPWPPIKLLVTTQAGKPCCPHKGQGRVPPPPAPPCPGVQPGRCLSALKIEQDKAETGNARFCSVESASPFEPNGFEESARTRLIAPTPDFRAIP